MYIGSAHLFTSPSGSTQGHNNYNILYIINYIIWGFDRCIETIARVAHYMRWHVSRKKILWHWPAGNSNPGPSDYQSDALSSELMEPG